MKKLREINIYRTNIRSISPKIGELPCLEALSLHNETLKEIPVELGQVKTLKRIYLYTPLNNYDFLEDLPYVESLAIVGAAFKTFPTFIRKMKNLETLTLLKCQIGNYPEWMEELEALKMLILSHNPLGAIHFGPKNSSLKKLELENCQLSSLPESIGLLSDLEYLDLYKNKLTALPEVIGQFSKLEGLNIDKNPALPLPDNLSGLNKLKYFQFDPKWLVDYPPVLLQLPILTKLPRAKQVPERVYSIPALARESHKKQYESDYALFLLDLLAERKEKVIAHPKFRAYICESLNCSIPLIQVTIQEILTSAYAAVEQKLDKKAVVAVAGNTSFNLNELRERLKNIGLVYSSKLDAKVTHVVLGKAPKKQAALIAQGQYTLLTEQILVDYLNKADMPYLLETDTNNNVDHLSTLFLSKDDDNVTVALQMLQGGGVPSEMITDLLIIYFTSQNQKNKKIARKLLEQYGPSALLPAYSNVNAPLRFIFQMRDMSRFQSNFEVLCKEYGLNPLKILRVLKDQINYYGKGLVDSYFLKYLPETEAQQYLLSLVDAEGTLELSRIILDKFSHHYFNNKQLINSVKKLVFENNQVKQVPDFILKFNNLKYLSLSSCNIAKLPAEFSDLTNLEELNLHYNSFKEFPKVLLKLTKLKKLSIGFSKINALPDELAEMKSLQILNVMHNQFEHLPPVLCKMLQLKELDVRKTYNSSTEYDAEEGNALKKALPDCKIELEYNYV